MAELVGKLVVKNKAIFSILERVTTPVVCQGPRVGEEGDEWRREAQIRSSWSLGLTRLIRFNSRPGEYAQRCPEGMNSATFGVCLESRRG